MKVPSDVAPSELFNLLLAEWHLPAPNLVVSLVGEERPFTMKSWLRDVLRKGLVKAAQSTGEAPPEPPSVASSVRPEMRAAPPGGGAVAEVPRGQASPQERQGHPVGLGETPSGMAAGPRACGGGPPTLSASPGGRSGWTGSNQLIGLPAQAA